MAKKRTIPVNDLGRQYGLHADEYRAKAVQVLDSGWYVLGREVDEFEREWASYVGSAHCVGLASGLDALWIAVRMLGIGGGDEVIVCSNAYIACVMGVTINGAKPVFVEPDRYLNLDASALEAAITSRTRAIMAVHLYGQCCDMDAVMDVANRYGLRVVEDCAQAHGTLWHGRHVGTFGDVGCFSFYPSKNLGAFGDGGCIVTNDGNLARATRTFRNYGSAKRYHNEIVGANSRLDELQAGLLRVKLAHLDELNAERMRIAARYSAAITNQHVVHPDVRPGCTCTWHQYVVRCDKRDELQEHLARLGIGTLIHYPIPPHLSEAYAYLGLKRGSLPVAERLASEVLSLPMFNGMTDGEQARVIDAVNSFGEE